MPCQYYVAMTIAEYTANTPNSIHDVLQLKAEICYFNLAGHDVYPQTEKAKFRKYTIYIHNIMPCHYYVAMTIATYTANTPNSI
ncbi:hypothetical protein, partial [Acinetobacter baumannii]|uniref:hypothetical protein n=1 Tax=Acinetobacter baumannii TaxID=470 RepID=UPI001C06B64A